MKYAYGAHHEQQALGKKSHHKFERVLKKIGILQVSCGYDEEKQGNNAYYCPQKKNLHDTCHSRESLLS